MIEKTFLVRDLIDWTGAQVSNESMLSIDPHLVPFLKVSDLKNARSGDLAFFFSKEYLQDLLVSTPSILLTGEAFVQPLMMSGHPLLKSTVILSVKNPYYAMALISKKLAPSLSAHAHVAESPAFYSKEDGTSTGIHPSAVIHPSVKLGKNVKIGAHVVIEENTIIEDHVTLYPSVYIGKDVKIGEFTTLFPKVTLYEKSVIGKRVRLHAGVVVGADGFGYAPIVEEGKVIHHEKIYHFGKVIIGDDVEMGANSLVDRGTLSDTIISNHVKIDNHCHVGHNSFIDEGAVLCGGVFLAGGATVGKFVYIGGMTGVGKFKIGDHAKIAGMSSVDKNVENGDTLVGFPGRSHRNFFKLQVLLNRLLEDRKNLKRKKI